MEAVAFIVFLWLLVGLIVVIMFNWQAKDHPDYIPATHWSHTAMRGVMLLILMVIWPWTMYAMMKDQEESWPGDY